MDDMIHFWSEINADYAWEISMFFNYRDFSDGVSFLEFDVMWDRYLADHTPKFIFQISVFNFTLIDFEVYYRHHRYEL